MVVEAVPEIGLGYGVPGPVGQLEVPEKYAGFLVFLGGVPPDVEVALARARPGPAGALEPWVLVGGVVDDQLGDDAQAPAVGLAQEQLEVGELAVRGVNVVVIRDVV